MTARILERLVASLPKDRVVTDDVVLEGRRHDSWMLSILDDLDGKGAPRPACVVRPRDVTEVVAVVKACREEISPLVPFGLGSGVCGGVLVSKDSVVLDMSAMNRVRSIDSVNLLAAFDAGFRGSDAEETLRQQGLTLGHYPQSIGLSSVGGWVATRAAGQFSTGYGNVEDLLFSLEAVLPNGEVVTTRDTPRASAGPDLRHVFLGSEGTLGVITGVTFSVRRAPESRAVSVFHVSTMAAGFDIQREIIQRGHAPPAMRQYDAVEAGRMFSAYAKDGAPLLLAVHEGPGQRVAAEVSAVDQVARSAGASPGAPEAAHHWLEERNHVPTFHQFLENGIVVDTIEVAATWTSIGNVYEAATRALSAVPGILAGTAHSSHVYRSGINLYFTFAARPERREDMADTYRACWRAVMDATVAAGGGISHHHGIGRIRREWLEAEIGKGGLSVLRALKRALDPTGFMNPGALVPDG